MEKNELENHVFSPIMIYFSYVCFSIFALSHIHPFHSHTLNPNVESGLYRHIHVLFFADQFAYLLQNR